MSLIDEVKQICDRLAQHGWRDLLLYHGLDITASNLKQEFAKELQNLDRDIKGFEDFALEGKRGIEPGNPAQSLFFHSLASPSVVKGANGSDLTAFPTLAELETVENYIYSIVSRGVEPPSLLDLRARVQGAKGAILAIAVFASEYRPAPETYRFEIYRHGEQSQDLNAPRKLLVAIEETVTLFVDPVRILLMRGEGNWKVGNA